MNNLYFKIVSVKGLISTYFSLFDNCSIFMCSIRKDSALYLMSVPIVHHMSDEDMFNEIQNVFGSDAIVSPITEEEFNVIGKPFKFNFEMKIFSDDLDC